jgi:hypothetical protein
MISISGELMRVWAGNRLLLSLYSLARFAFVQYMGFFEEHGWDKELIVLTIILEYI